VQIPNAPADLTPAWLTDILRQSGMLRDSSVVSIKISLVPDGRGFAAQSARLRLTYDIAGNDAPRSMFLKLSVANPDSREKLRVVGLYETETGFYRELNGSCPLRTPQVYASLYEPHTGESLLLLEDIGSLRFGDNLTGSTIEEARTAISSLARMQAHYWNNPQMEKCVWLRSAKHDRQDVPTLYRSLRPIFE
jgi:hypothetical protein